MEENKSSFELHYEYADIVWDLQYETEQFSNQEFLLFYSRMKTLRDFWFEMGVILDPLGRAMEENRVDDFED